jgi:hypothetical protein
MLFLFNTVLFVWDDLLGIGVVAAAVWVSRSMQIVIVDRSSTVVGL